MADLFRSFLDFRPLHTSYKLHVVLPSKHLSSTHIYSHSSRIRRINRRPFHLKLISRSSALIPSSIDVVSTHASNVDLKDSSAQSIDMEDTGDTEEYLNDEKENSSMKSVSSNFDVISTHEHSDGSLIFRFGDLSESASNAQLEESKVEKDIEEEGTEEDHMVTDLNGDDDGGVRDSSLAEVTNESTSMDFDGKNLSISEKKNNLGNDIENDGKDEECFNEKKDSSSLMSVPMVANSSKIENSIAAVETPENNIVDVTMLQTISLSPDTLTESEKDAFQDSIDTVVSTELFADSRIGDDINNILTVAPGMEAALRLSEDDDNVNGNIVESSGNQVMEMEPTEVSIKSQEIQMTDFVLSSGAALLPHPSKVLTGGEDAYFVTGQTWLGVADGVGQWSFEGTNPGVYAQELIKNCEKLALDCNSDSICNPTELLKLSVGETQSPGSSTVLLAQLVGQVLQVANIGDSGFIILRHGSVYKRSSPMLHVFHFPLQIERGDDPSNLVEFYRIDLEEEDVIILASDGLLDNLYDQEITSEVSKYLAADCKPKEIAEALAAKAQEVGKSVTARSPFADNAQAAGCAGYTGGKLDDVTVIVSMVQRQSSSQTL